MPRTVNIPGMGPVNFPDTMNDDQIADAIKTKILPQQPPPQSSPPGTEGTVFKKRDIPEGSYWYATEEKAPIGQSWGDLLSREAWTPEEMARGAAKPFTGFMGIQAENERRAREQASTGIKQLATPGERMKGAFNTAIGAASWALSPVESTVESFAGRPIERTTGLPHEYTDFAITLGLPVVGFAKTPKTLQKVFSPETVSPEAMKAAGLIRQKTGVGARDIAMAEDTFEPWQKVINTLDPQQQLELLKYIDNPTTAAVPATPQLRAFADMYKGVMKEARSWLEQLPQHQQMNFFEDFAPHMWKDPTAAQNLIRGGGMGVYKQGSAASTKARTIPTYAEGIEKGLEPLTTNPLELGQMYINSIRKYVTSQQILNTAKDAGVVIYEKPRVLGASGRPESLKIPQGYAPLEGRGSLGPGGERAYAPEDWARVYNNFISRGFEQIGGGEYGSVYNAARRTANAITQTVLSFSGYHAFTMAEAGMSNQMAKTLMALRRGRPFEATKEFGKWPQSPIRYAFRGKDIRDMYLGKVPMSAEDKEIIDLLTEAGGRLSGSKHALDYEMSALGDYLTSYRRGKLKMEMLAQGQDIKANPILGTARTAASNIGRIMETFNKPLFQHYIPSMKNAAAYENMAQWLKLNPNATAAEKLAAARKIVDSVDNRFGEMIHDNIFWNKVAKQSAMLAMLSYSWNMGGVREIGGGVRDIARTAVGRGEWTPKADYVVGMTLNWAVMSAVYQYMKTGEPPRDVHDLAAPRTGGTDYLTGEPERIIPPGIMKDVFGYYEHFGQEVMNKMNPGLRLGVQSLSTLGGQGGYDWRGDPILSPRSPGQSTLEKAPDWLAEYFDFVRKGMSPIQSQQLGRGPEQGSALNALELGLGIRKAPRQLVSPDQNEAMLDTLWRRRWQRKQRHDLREKERYQGPVE